MAARRGSWPVDLRRAECLRATPVSPRYREPRIVDWMPSLDCGSCCIRAFESDHHFFPIEIVAASAAW